VEGGGDKSKIFTFTSAKSDDIVEYQVTERGFELG
jgi:hypothetical protein